MGAAILSVPFRLNSSGAIATVDQDSAQADAEQIGVVVATRQGEREQHPTFGMPDPVGRGFDPAALVAALSAFGPAVAVDNVTITNQPDGTQTVDVSF